MNKKTKIVISSLSQLCLYLGAVVLVSSLNLQDPKLTPPIRDSISEKDIPVLMTVEDKAVPAHTEKTKKTSPQDTPMNYQTIKESVTKEVKYRMFSTPNDPNYSNDWALSKIDASIAWSLSTGNGQTIVAVIDGGYALNHEELVTQWHTNSGEIGSTELGDVCWSGASQNKATNNCDDDNNGYKDDWRGWNFILGDNNPQTGRENIVGDGVRHGSQVAGIVGALSNNGIGIASIAWNTKIMPLQALDDDGSGYTSTVASAIYYAVDNGADVINMSLGAYESDVYLETAINYAIDNGVVVVAASGNCGDSSSLDCLGVFADTVAYPAAYPNVIAVGASTQSDTRASFSSYGQALDVVAPGYNVPRSTSWTISNQSSAYATNLNGTSFAAPFVSSLASLIKSIRPSTSVNDIVALINATTSKPVAMSGNLYTNQFGHGVINAGSALTIASSLNATSSTPELLQAGSYRSEHTTYSNDTISSGCRVASGTVCTIELSGSNGFKRYLPYSILSGAGSTGWSWSSNMLDSAFWEIRARQGENTSTTPYLLLRK